MQKKMKVIIGGIISFLLIFSCKNVSVSKNNTADNKKINQTIFIFHRIDNSIDYYINTLVMYPNDTLLKNHGFTLNNRSANEYSIEYCLTIPKKDTFSITLKETLSVNLMKETIVFKKYFNKIVSYYENNKIISSYHYNIEKDKKDRLIKHDTITYKAFKDKEISYHIDIYNTVDTTSIIYRYNYPKYIDKIVGFCNVTRLFKDSNLILHGAVNNAGKYEFTSSTKKVIKQDTIIEYNKKLIDKK